MYKEESLSELEKLAENLIQLRKKKDGSQWDIPNAEKKYLDLESQIKSSKPDDEEQADEMEKALKRIRERLDANE